MQRARGLGPPRGCTYLVDADLGLHILQALLQDGDEGSRRHESPIDVGLAYVALDTERERRVRKTCSKTGRPAFREAWTKGGRHSH